MTLWSMLGAWPQGQDKAARAIRAEADALIDLWGDDAHDVAANLSFREDAGLLRSPSPGHWSRVQDEIGRRRAKEMAPPAIALTSSPWGTDGLRA